MGLSHHIKRKNELQNCGPILLHLHVIPPAQFLLTWLSDDKDADRAKQSVIHGLVRKRIRVNFCWWNENLC
jgi:hypothetical protein